MKTLSKTQLWQSLAHFRQVIGFASALAFPFPLVFAHAAPVELLGQRAPAALAHCQALQGSLTEIKAGALHQCKTTKRGTFQYFLNSEGTIAKVSQCGRKAAVNQILDDQDGKKYVAAFNLRPSTAASGRRAVHQFQGTSGVITVERQGNARIQCLSASSTLHP